MKINDIFKTIRKPIRCYNCNKLLLMGKLKSGCSLEIKCPRCIRYTLVNIYDKIDNKENMCYNVNSKKEEL